jgi:uncharacterized protein
MNREVSDDKHGVSAHAAARLAGLLLFFQPALLAQFPPPMGYVNDFAFVLDEGAETYLENFLTRLERDTSAEVVVAIVPSLEGLTVEAYANRLFNDWKIGQAQEDNGVLLLVAPSDRTVRIEVGYGLEPILPDGLAGEIIRTEIVPEFKSGNFPRGIGRGLNRIAQIVRRDPAAMASPEVATGSFPSPLLMVPFFASFIVLGAFAAGLGVRTKTYLPLIWAAVFAGMPLAMLAAFSSIGSVAIAVPLGLGALAIGYRKGQSPYWTSILRKGAPDSADGGRPITWVAGGSAELSSGGSSHDGSSSSSSGSFGGGSSGGGGASGRW